MIHFAQRVDIQINIYIWNIVNNFLLCFIDQAYGTFRVEKHSWKASEVTLFSIMVDETTDVTNKEQVTVVMCRIDEKFEVFEEFLGLYSVPSIDAASLFSVIRDTLVRLNLPFSKIRGQCYDGCSTMSGSRSGIAKRVKDEEPCAVIYSLLQSLATSSCQWLYQEVKLHE